MLTLSPEKLPSPVKELGKCLKVETMDQKIILIYIRCSLMIFDHIYFVKVCKGLLVAEDSPEDHPDIKEMRRRVLSNFSELSGLDILREK